MRGLLGRLSSPYPSASSAAWSSLQEDGAKSFVASWNELMEVIASKAAALETSGD